MNLTNAVRRQSMFWLLVLGLWLLLVLAFAGQLVYSRNEQWLNALGIAMRDWFPWLFLSPAVGWLAFRFPLEREKLSSSVPAHILGCVLTVLIYEVFAPLPFRPEQLRRPDQAVEQGGQAAGELPGEAPPRRPFPRHPGDRGGPPPDAFPPFTPEAGNPPLHLTATGRFVNRSVIHARFNLPIYWVIVSIAHALTYYRRSEERRREAIELEARLNEAKLDALRMQLQPHFLFNTLNAISTLVHKDPQAADEMIGNLSELLRATLETNHQEIALREELRFLDRYLEIQQARFGNRLQIEKDIDAAALDVAVPALILQPLVENSIRHGIEPQLTSGRIRIEAKTEAGVLKLAVRDNGCGLQESKGGAGVGLSNTRARLEQLYGRTAKLLLKSGSETGCSVEMELPIREQNSNTHR